MYSSPRPSKWIAVTAGFLPTNFEQAANRVEKDLLGIYPFEKILKFTNMDLKICAPRTLAKYQAFLREGVPGYGYYSWKPEIVSRTLDGEFGDCDGVVWIDGGCEVLNTPWTRKKFRNQIRMAEQSGYLVFDLDTPEYRYSKSDIIGFFPTLSKSDRSPQVQATHFFLHGATGREIARTWREVGLSDIHSFDHTPSREGDPADFVLHKSDQSIFSLTVKSLKLQSRMATPPAGNRGMLSVLSALRAPIWLSRNREGKSLKGPLVKLVERITK